MNTKTKSDNYVDNYRKPRSRSKPRSQLKRQRFIFANQFFQQRVAAAFVVEERLGELVEMRWDFRYGNPVVVCLREVCVELDFGTAEVAAAKMRIYKTLFSFSDATVLERKQILRCRTIPIFVKT